jgi:hypothetical protein
LFIRTPPEERASDAEASHEMKIASTAAVASVEAAKISRNWRIHVI